MSNNPYVDQVCQQTGMTAREVYKSSRSSDGLLSKAQSLGYETVAEYEEALADFLNGL